MRRASFLLPALLATTAPALAQTAPQDSVSRIIDEGSNQSEVMRIAQYLTDVIGARLTNSPGMRRAEEWTAAKFREWGLANTRKDGFEFGRGWESQSATVRMVGPRPLQLTAAPLAWTPGTNGPITAPIVLAPLNRSLETYRGKLQSKIVLVSEPIDLQDATEAPFKRLSEADLVKADALTLPNARRPNTGGGGGGGGSPSAAHRDAFLKQEGALAYVTMSYRDGKLVHGQSSQFEVGKSGQLPGFELAAEDYRRLARLTQMGVTPTLEVNSTATFIDGDTKAYNILADIPGSDPRSGYVMAGAHLDSWAMGDGAADNAAGVAMVMEAARIIKASGIRTKRTIRFALWAGEEQGLLGSMAYVENNIATRPVDPKLTGIDRYLAWTRVYPITQKPGHAQLAAYFNIDNGSGAIRGISTQGNTAVVPIFRDWLAPFNSMGASTVATRRVGGTDHVFFDAVGIPAFQFIQDPLDYGSTLHHTNADTFDHLKSEDMRKGAIILAHFLVQAANSDKPLPRLPIPAAPKTTDGFYPAPGAAN